MWGEMKNMQEYNNKKITLIAGIISYITVYIVVRYGLVLFAPFVVAYLVAWCIRPVFRLFVTRARMKNGAAAFTVVIIVVLLLLGVMCGLGIKTLSGIEKLASVWSIYKNGVMSDVKQTCCYIENGIGLKNGVVYNMLVECVGNVDVTHMTSRIMYGSVSAARISAEYLVFVIVVLVSAFYYIKDKEIIDKKRDSSLFGTEINRITGSIYTIGIAYLKAQIVIVVITFIVCLIGFYFAGIKYAAIYAAIVSVLDALPLLGTGLFILPVAVVYALKRKYITAVIMVIVFILCYCIREVLEPKIMGKNVGLSPVITMAAMYTGYRLFGLFGVITGPFAYIAARELTEIIKEAYIKYYQKG